MQYFTSLDWKISTLRLILTTKDKTFELVLWLDINKEYLQKQVTMSWKIISKQPENQLV